MFRSSKQKKRPKNPFSLMIVINGVMFVVAVLAAIIIWLLFFSSHSILRAQEEEDTQPPLIYDVKVEEISATSSVITWKTNEESDSLINYGLDTNYGIARDPFFDKTEHQIELKNLLPGTKYYFRITSSDAFGNQGISSDYSFVTKDESEITEAEKEAVKEGSQGEEAQKGSGQTEGEEQQPGQGQGEGQEAGQGEQITVGEGTVREIIQAIQKITDAQALEQIAKVVQAVAEERVSPPLIIEGYPEIVEVGSDYVIVRWLTTSESNSIIALATDEQYQPDADEPYAWKQGEPDEMVIVHELTVTGLQPATLYHYQVRSRGLIGPEARSPDRTFTTKSIMPEIYNINLEKVEETSATISWSTNVPCSSIIEYTNLENNETRSEGHPNFVTRHSVRLTNLVYDTTYAAVIHVENEYGEKNASAPITFTTTKDEIPPVISKVKTESTIYPGAETKIQTIVSWETDEEATCQFFYHQGLFAGDKENSLPAEVNPTTRHIQVETAFQSATVYRFWIVCKDLVGNEARSEDFTLLTPEKEQSIIDIIISNFQSTFGWMKKIGK
jgi:hypothetical protein